MTEKKVHSYTNYSKIYRKSYWGNFTKSFQSINDDIIDNRNNFILNNDIIAYKVPKYIGWQIMELRNKSSIFDHIECYKTNNNHYILIASPYVVYDDEYTSLGWTKTDKLYCVSAHTYMKIIPFKNKKY